MGTLAFITSIVGFVGLVMSVLPDLLRRKPGTAEAHWEEGCECCTAGCGETGDENRCLICGH